MEKLKHAKRQLDAQVAEKSEYIKRIEQKVVVGTKGMVRVGSLAWTASRAHAAARALWSSRRAPHRDSTSRRRTRHCASR